MSKFKVGDIVTYTDSNDKTYQGKVVKAAKNDNGSIIVSFGDDFNGWNLEKYKNCWYCGISELKLFSINDDKPMKHKFKTGDMVACHVKSKEMVGEVLSYEESGFIKVAFPYTGFIAEQGFFPTLTLVSKNFYKSECHLFFDEKELKLVSGEGVDKMSKDKEIKIIINEPVIIATRGDKKGIARCCPEDTFDLSVGINLAVERLEAAEGKKFVPKEDETYWYVKPNNNEVYIYESTFASWYYSDILNVALGNCFTTQQAAIDNKEKIAKRLKALISCAESLRDGVH